MCTMCVIGANRVHKRNLDPLGLEVQMALSHHVVLRRKLQSSARAVVVLNHLALSPVLSLEALNMFLDH